MMDLGDFLRERGGEVEIFKHGYQSFDGVKLTLDGRYSLKELRILVDFMEEAEEPSRGSVDSMRKAALTVPALADKPHVGRNRLSLHRPTSCDNRIHGDEEDGQAGGVPGDQVSAGAGV